MRMHQTTELRSLPALNVLIFPGAENGTLLWTPKSLEPFTLEILARSAKIGLASALQPRTVVCHCKAESQCLYNQTSRVGNSSLEVSVGRQVRSFCAEGRGNGSGTDAVILPLLGVLVLGGGWSRFQSQAINSHGKKENFLAGCSGSCL